MRLRVEREDGHCEVIELRGEILHVVIGHYLDRVVDGLTEHFFTKAGFYDGQGRVVAATEPSRPTGFSHFDVLRPFSDSWPFGLSGWLAATEPSRPAEEKV